MIGRTPTLSTRTSPQIPFDIKTCDPFTIKTKNYFLMFKTLNFDLLTANAFK